MRTYKQLTHEQRYQISALMKMGHQQTQIANCIGVGKSMISRELSRNRGQRGYRPKQAHGLAMSRCRIARHFGIHHCTVSLWVQASAASLPEVPVSKEVKTAEMDELFTFIGNKKTGSPYS